jgi:hypothetical protein
MTKPKDMCEKCWAVWKDIITSAVMNWSYVGKFTEEDLEFLHCHHPQDKYEDNDE